MALASMPSEDDPVLGREGSPLGYLTLGLNALDPSNVGSFLSANAPDMSGIVGLVPSGEGTRNFLQGLGYALEAGAAVGQGRTPLYLQQQQMDLYRQQLDNQRLTTALQIQQREAARQESLDKEALALWSNPQLTNAQKKKMSAELGARGNILATNLGRLADDELISKLDVMKQYLPAGKYEELSQIMHTPNADITPVEQWAKYAEEKHKAVKETQFKSERFADLLQRHEQTPLDPTSAEFDELNQLVQERKKRVEEAKKLSMDIQSIKQDIAFKQHAPKEVYSGPKGAEGQIVTGVYDPTTQKVTEFTGTPKPGVSVNIDNQKFTPEQAGRVSAMNATLADIRQLRALLVKDGKVNRTSLLSSSFFAGLPFSGGRDLTRWIEDAVETKLRLETGAAANKEEVVRIAKRFRPSNLDSDATIIGKLDALEFFARGAFDILDPTGSVRARLGPRSELGPPPIPFQQAYDLVKKEHPDWDKNQIFDELSRRGVQP